MVISFGLDLLFKACDSLTMNETTEGVSTEQINPTPTEGDGQAILVESQNTTTEANLNTIANTPQEATPEDPSETGVGQATTLPAETQDSGDSAISQEATTEPKNAEMIVKSEIISHLKEVDPDFFNDLTPEQQQELMAKGNHELEIMLDEKIFNEFGMNDNTPEAAQVRENIKKSFDTEQLLAMIKIKKIQQAIERIADLDLDGPEEEQEAAIIAQAEKEGKDPQSVLDFWKEKKDQIGRLGTQWMITALKFANHLPQGSDAKKFLDNFFSHHGSESAAYGSASETQKDTSVGKKDFENALKYQKDFAKKLYHAYDKEGGMREWLILNPEQKDKLKKAQETEDPAILKEVLFLVCQKMFSEGDEQQREKAWTSLSKNLGETFDPSKKPRLSGEVKVLLEETYDKGRNHPNEYLVDYLPNSGKKSGNQPATQSPNASPIQQAA